MWGHRGGLIALALAVTGLAGWWLGWGRGDEASLSKSPHAAISAPLRTPPHVAMPRSDDSPEHRPVATALSSLGPAELLRRADAGDAAASCRLAVEWMNCRTVQSRLGAMEVLLDERAFAQGLSQLPAVVRDRMVEQREKSLPRIQREADAVLAQSARCDTMPAADDRSLLNRWRQGALGGNAVAMRRYAIGEAFQSTKYMDFLPELLLYKRDAEAIAVRAVEAGDFMTAVALAHAYGTKGDADNGGLLNDVVEYEPVRALALYRRVQAAAPAGPAGRQLDQEIEPVIARLLVDMTPAQRGEAEALARQARPLSNPGNVAPFPLLTRGNAGPVTPDECEGAAPTAHLLSGGR